MSDTDAKGFSKNIDNGINMFNDQKEQLPQTREWRNAWKIDQDLIAA